MNGRANLRTPGILRRSFRLVCGLVTVVSLVGTMPLTADGGVTFEDLAAGGAHGLAYERVPSATDVIWDQFRAAGFFAFFDLPNTPLKSRGAPGVAVFDYDRDGDLDLYVTNGPSAANSLFANQLSETGVLTFIDLAEAAGVAAADLDSSGVCFGDTDNDGDDDLFVLSAFASNRFYENRGDGTFLEISAGSGLGLDSKTSVSCSFGDIDGDGLLDVMVANCCLTMADQFATGTPEPFAFNQHNQLYRNLGGNTFADVSATSGILDHRGFPPGFDGSPTVTWAVALVDIDLDGDADIVTADDQAAVPLPRDGGVARGLIHLFENDGSGHFVDRVVEAGLDRPGAWMGLSFGDLDADGTLDLFGTNLGDWATTLLTPFDPVYGDFVRYELGDMTSRWYLGGADGVFSEPDLGDIVATPFGWGTVMADYDNDGDTDIVFHGGILPGPVVQTSPGNILANDGTGRFQRDSVALAGSTDHERRTVHGVASGDLDRDGFVDLVSVSNFDLPETASLATYNHPWGSPFDFGRYLQFFEPTDTPFLTAYSGVEFENGSLSVERNQGNGNRSVTVELVGAVDLVDGAVVNRSGIGGVVTVVPRRGRPAMQPVLGGSSYASQNSLALGFGLGRERRAQVDVLWPGGVRNRLYGARAGEHVRFPEIPCSYDADWPSFYSYLACVRPALDELVAVDFLSRHQRGRFLVSAVLAYFETRSY